MHILCLGLNHDTASLRLREKLAFTEESLKAALSRLQCGGVKVDSVSEMVILSTCNRVEVYAAASVVDFHALATFLSDARNISMKDLKGHLYYRADEEAVEHLFGVASGLDSLVIGEAQILGQVARAFELARGQNTCGPILSRLFQSAIHMGKRARTETAIGHNPASVSSVAVRLATEVVPDLASARVSILGAGEMAELTVEALRKRGVHHIQVVNRTLDRARELAERWNGAAATFEMLPEVLIQSDILISSTSAPHTLLHTEMVSEILPHRNNRPFFMIDIAVPRDIDEEVGRLPGVALYDMDSLQNHLADSLAERRQEIPHVEAIVEEEKQRFLEFMITLDVLPLIAEIHKQAEALRQAELDKTLRRLPDLNDSERQRIEAMTNALVKKLLHAPLSRLRSEAGGPGAATYASFTRALFGLEDVSSQTDVQLSGDSNEASILPGGSEPKFNLDLGSSVYP